ncbi:MAG: Asp-tRNA(Asn)/Glu-tRNA(Gln) amidotransferase subunit GatC [bacterium]
MAQFDRDALRHLARLARLDLPDVALPHYAEQLEGIFGLFQGLVAVDTSAIGTVIASFDDLTLTPRPDTPRASLPRDAALAPSSRREGDCLAVPRVLTGAVEAD